MARCVVAAALLAAIRERGLRRLRAPTPGRAVRPRLQHSPRARRASRRRLGLAVERPDARPGARGQGARPAHRRRRLPRHRGHQLRDHRRAHHRRDQGSSRTSRTSMPIALAPGRRAEPRPPGRGGRPGDVPQLHDRSGSRRARTSGTGSPAASSRSTSRSSRRLPVDDNGFVGLGSTDDAPAVHIGAYAPQAPLVDAVVNDTWIPDLDMTRGQRPPDPHGRHRARARSASRSSRCCAAPGRRCR